MKTSFKSRQFPCLHSSKIRTRLTCFSISMFLNQHTLMASSLSCKTSIQMNAVFHIDLAHMEGNAASSVCQREMCCNNMSNHALVSYRNQSEFSSSENLQQGTFLVNWLLEMILFCILLFCLKERCLKLQADIKNND